MNKHEEEARNNVETGVRLGAPEQMKSRVRLRHSSYNPSVNWYRAIFLVYGHSLKNQRLNQIWRTVSRIAIRRVNLY